MNAIRNIGERAKCFKMIISKKQVIIYIENITTFLNSFPPFLFLSKLNGIKNTFLIISLIKTKLILQVNATKREKQPF